jgi:hypothetical protein
MHWVGIGDVATRLQDLVLYQWISTKWRRFSHKYWILTGMKMFLISLYVT